jgi:hypothetical protein
MMMVSEKRTNLRLPASGATGYGCLYRLNIPDNCIEAIVARYEVSKAEHIKERDIACYPLHNLLANDTESTSSPSSRPAR